MALEVEPFLHAHLHEMDEEPRSVGPAEYDGIIDAVTYRHDGRVVACVGGVACMPGHPVAQVFARFAIGAGPHMLGIIRHCRRWWATWPVERIEAYVQADCPNTRRTVEHIGMTCETPAGIRKFDGRRDAYLYGMVR